MLCARSKSTEFVIKTFLAGIVLCFSFVLVILLETSEYQVNAAGWVNVYTIPSTVFSFNGVSGIFLLLTYWLLAVSFIISWNSVKNLAHFAVQLNVLGILLAGMFLTTNILAFYGFFEAIIIPMYMLINAWGSKWEKTRAAMYFFFFTLVTSFFFLGAVLYIWANCHTLCMLKIAASNHLSENQQIMLMAFMGIAMLTKIPMFPVHIWLPLAHTEAPLAGSILLAGILLKIGGYGLIVVILPICPLGWLYFKSSLAMLSMASAVLAALITLRQTDFKKLIAYSSVSHMGIVSAGIFSAGPGTGFNGSILLMIGHGLVSPAMFIIAGILYNRFNTRTLRYYKGMQTCMPVLCTLSLLTCMASFPIPSTLSFVGEVLVFLGGYSTYGTFFVSGLAFSAVVGMAYTLLTHTRIFTGQPSAYTQVMARDVTEEELWALVALLHPVFFFGCFPSLLTIPMSGMTETCHALVLTGELWAEAYKV